MPRKFNSTNPTVLEAYRLIKEKIHDVWFEPEPRFIQDEGSRILVGGSVVIEASPDGIRTSGQGTSSNSTRRTMFSSYSGQCPVFAGTQALDQWISREVFDLSAFRNSLKQLSRNRPNGRQVEAAVVVCGQFAGMLSEEDLPKLGMAIDVAKASVFGPRASAFLWKVIHGKLDRDLARFSAALNLGKFSLDTYNVLAGHRTSVMQLLADNRHLSPLLGCTDSACQHLRPSDAYYRDAKKALGIGGALWKRMCSSFAVTKAVSFCGKAAIRRLNAVLNDVPDLPFSALRLVIGSGHRLPDPADCAAWMRAFAPGIAEAKRKGRLYDFLLSIEDAMDWFADECSRAAKQERANPPVPKAWRRILDKSRRWHDAQIKATPAPDHKCEWASLVGAQTIDGVAVVPITDNIRLHEDGLAMRHCVGSYAYACQQGNSRIFSLVEEASGLRATLELRRVGVRWVVTQIRGPHNKRPFRKATEVSRKVRVAYLQAERKAQAKSRTSGKERLLGPAAA